MSALKSLDRVADANALLDSIRQKVVNRSEEKNVYLQILTDLARDFVAAPDAYVTALCCAMGVCFAWGGEAGGVEH